MASVPLGLMRHGAVLKSRPRAGAVSYSPQDERGRHCGGLKCENREDEWADQQRDNGEGKSRHAGQRPACRFVQSEPKAGPGEGLPGPLTSPEQHPSLGGPLGMLGIKTGSPEDVPAKSGGLTALALTKLQSRYFR